MTSSCLSCCSCSNHSLHHTLQEELSFERHVEQILSNTMEEKALIKFVRKLSIEQLKNPIDKEGNVLLPIFAKFSQLKAAQELMRKDGISVRSDKQLEIYSSSYCISNES